MKPAVHIAQGAISAAALYPVLQDRALLFGLSVVLIDLDHLLEYLWDTRDWSLRGFFIYHEVLYRNLALGYLSLNIFHTVEFSLLGILIGTWHPFLYPVVAGCLFHHLLDMVGLVRLGYPRCKSFSVIEYFLRRKSHLRSVREVLRHPSVSTGGIAGIEELSLRWGAVPTSGGR